MRHRGGVPATSTAAVAAWAAPKSKKRAFRGVGDAQLLSNLEELQKLLDAGELASARGKHFVALYADLYTRVYGTMPLDMGPKQRAIAAKLADDMIAKDFAGPAEMAEYVAWSWTREKEREAWRRETGQGGGRVAWGQQFGRRMLADFRLAKAREKKDR